MDRKLLDAATHGSLDAMVAAVKGGASVNCHTKVSKPSWGRGANTRARTLRGIWQPAMRADSAARAVVTLVRMWCTCAYGESWLARAVLAPVPCGLARDGAFSRDTQLARCAHHWYRHQSRSTPLMLACSAGNAKCVSFLLKMRADPNTKNRVRRAGRPACCGDGCGRSRVRGAVVTWCCLGASCHRRATCRAARRHSWWQPVQATLRW